MVQKHIVITGEVGVGKSTLINRLLLLSTREICGFVTCAQENEDKDFRSIYLYKANQKTHIGTEANHIGDCQQRLIWKNPKVFNSLGVKYLCHSLDSIIVMDELGFLELDALDFCKNVFDCFNGQVPVIAAVKAKPGIAFLEEIKTHPNVTVYNITHENRDLLYNELSKIVTLWNK